jgi:hypothetical protein
MAGDGAGENGVEGHETEFLVPKQHVVFEVRRDANLTRDSDKEVSQSGQEAVVGLGLYAISTLFVSTMSVFAKLAGTGRPGILAASRRVALLPTAAFVATCNALVEAAIELFCDTVQADPASPSSKSSWPEALFSQASRSPRCCATGRRRWATGAGCCLSGGFAVSWRCPSCFGPSRCSRCRMRSCSPSWRPSSLRS